MSHLDWSPVGLSADPVPGDPEIVRHGGEEYLEVAEAIARAQRTLAHIDLGSFVISEAVDAVRTTASEVAENIGRAHARYESTGDALVTYATTLSTSQTEARAALRDAVDAVSVAEESRSAQRRYLRLARDTDDPQAALYYEQLADERAVEVSLAETARADARSRVEGAVTARDKAAETAIESIERTTRGDSLGDSWWDDWGKDVLAVITDVAGWVATIAGILALAVCWIPAIGQALAAILLTVAAVAALVNAIGNVVLAIDGERSWAEAGLSILGAVLSVVGLGGAARLAIRGVQAVRGTSTRVVGSPLTAREFLRLKPRDLRQWVRDLSTPVPQPHQNQLIYRLHGNGSHQFGGSWTPVNPRTLANPRQQLGLPDVNGVTHVTVIRLTDPSIVAQVRRGLPYSGKLGGAPEYVLPRGFDKLGGFDSVVTVPFVP